MRAARFSAVALACLALALPVGCGGSSDAPGKSGGGGATSSSTDATATSGAGGSGGATSSSTAATTTSGSGGGSGGSSACGDDVAPPNEVLPDATDPEQGVFTLEQALAGLPPGPGPLRAVIDTDLGTLTCTLHDDVAPNGVANFVGLARGRRAFKDPVTKQWVRRPFYDGLVFHRVIADFVAQGGDPLGTGYGGPGYSFKDEIGDLHHLAGTLAYANAGPNTNGSQFYVCETPQPGLDGGYTIFGECAPVDVVTAITHVPTDAQDKPLTPVHMKTVKITRCAE